MNNTGWFGKAGTAKLATQQQNTAGGISAVTRTMIAAYKQFDDVEFLLSVVAQYKADIGDPPGTVDDRVALIRDRHEKYRVAQAQEVLP